MEKRHYSDDAACRIIAELDAAAALDLAAVPRRRRGTRTECLCPSAEHNDAHFGNAFVSKDGTHVHCYACGRTMDGIQILRENLGLTFPEALDMAAEAINMTDLADRPGKKKGGGAPKYRYRLLTPDERVFLGFDRGASRHEVPVSCGPERPEKGACREEHDGYGRYFVGYRTERYDALRETAREAPEFYRDLVRRRAKEQAERLFEQIAIIRRLQKADEARGGVPIGGDAAAETVAEAKRAIALFEEFGGQTKKTVTE